MRRFVHDCDQSSAERTLTYSVCGQRVVLQVLIPFVELFLDSVHERLLKHERTFATFVSACCLCTRDIPAQRLCYSRSRRGHRPRGATASDWRTGTSSVMNNRQLVSSLVKSACGNCRDNLYGEFNTDYTEHNASVVHLQETSEFTSDIISK